jgi:hypothetical protein
MKFHSLAALILPLLAGVVQAALPPEHLRIPGHRDCLSETSMGTWNALCIPDAKPEACVEGSWAALGKLQYLKKCSEAEGLKDSVLQHEHHHHHHHDLDQSQMIGGENGIRSLRGGASGISPRISS